mmetsp:Transcript_26294/g.84530  ORF Transcript_26294/g.84530 Transcript_26294/m.84530 type:complete len:251 (-) Transcript_26294:79-831(-)
MPAGRQRDAPGRRLLVRGTPSLRGDLRGPEPRGARPVFQPVRLPLGVAVPRVRAADPARDPRVREHAGGAHAAGGGGAPHHVAPAPRLRRARGARHGRPRLAAQVPRLPLLQRAAAVRARGAAPARVRAQGDRLLPRLPPLLRPDLVAAVVRRAKHHVHAGLCDCQNHDQRVLTPSAPTAPGTGGRRGEPADWGLSCAMSRPVDRALARAQRKIRGLCVPVSESISALVDCRVRRFPCVYVRSLTRHLRS